MSFVDCPGHDILMATMLNGAAVMDAALLLIGKGDYLLLLATDEKPTHLLHLVFSRQRIVSATSDVGTLGRHRNHEAEAHTYTPEQD